MTRGVSRGEGRGQSGAGGSDQPLTPLFLLADHRKFSIRLEFECVSDVKGKSWSNDFDAPDLEEVTKELYLTTFATSKENRARHCLEIEAATSSLERQTNLSQCV